jgi:hypothetical protein
VTQRILIILWSSTVVTQQTDQDYAVNTPHVATNHLKIFMSGSFNRVFGSCLNRQTRILWAPDADTMIDIATFRVSENLTPLL